MCKSFIFLCLAAFAHLVAPETVEVAGGKTGTLPATPYSGVSVAEMAARITDGDTDPSNFARTCALVSRMKNPWITIDLGKTYYVTEVALFTREWVPAAKRESNLEVRVGNSESWEDNAVCTFMEGHVLRPRQVKCNQGLMGRYITVYRNDDVVDYLQLCEMKTFADVGYIGSCVCWGDPHCQSFDKAPWLHYQGSCSYTMVQTNCKDGLPDGEPEVEVIADNKKNHPSHSVSLVRRMIIKIKKHDMEIIIDQGKHTTVNGVTVQGTPFHPAPGVAISMSGGYVYVSVDDEIRVRYDGVYNAYVDVARPLAGKVCGLCGNADGDSSNDWMVGPSKDCMDKFPGVTPGTISTDLNVVGNSWLAEIDSDASCLVECPEPPVLPGCTKVSQELAEQHCEILQDMSGPFGDCLAQLPAADRLVHFDNCVFDSCSLELYDTIVCTFAHELAQQCAQLYAIQVDWRTRNFCPLDCPAGMEYSTCGNPCLPTCDDPKGEQCDIPAGTCEEGCFCEANMVFDGEKCIPKTNCGCVYPEQDVTIAVGDTFFADDCSEKCTCPAAGATLDCEDTSCKGEEVCGVVDGEPGCVCEAPNEIVNGKCKAPAAGCTTGNGVEIAVGETVMADDCSETCTCEEAGADPVCEEVECDAPAVCGEENGKTACTCPDPNILIDGVCKPPQFACTLPRDPGVGGASENRFYFNKDKCKCIKFTYKGDGGNANNFGSEADCLAVCTGFETPAECLPAPEYGACDGSTNMYYYHQKSNKCKKFKYSGCGGNTNRFDDKLACRNLCKRC